LNNFARQFVVVLGGAAVVIFCGRVHGQTSQPPPKFDVASIKPSRPDAPGPPFEITPGGSVTVNTTLWTLIQQAYSVKEYQLGGAPKWLQTEYYRIVAKPPVGPVPDGQNAQNRLFEQRMRYLLEERCQLVVHRETRTIPEYALIVAKGGPKLKEMEHDDAKFKLRFGKGFLTTVGGAKIPMLVSILSNQLHYPVVDATGLDKYYDIQLKYPVEEDANAALFSALQDQLGLKLESRKGPIEMLVIDKIERPANN
jgi:uncharacterized protein (TIGR03435 family)